MKPIEHNGILYRSHAELANFIGMSAQKFHQRKLNRGSIQEAIDFPKRAKQGKVIAGFESFRNMKSIAAAYGVSYGEFSKDLRNGIDPKESIESLVSGRRGQRGTTYSYMGVDYPSVSALARECSVSYHPLRKRILEEGMSPDEALMKCRGFTPETMGPL